MATVLPKSVLEGPREILESVPGWSRVFLLVFGLYALATIGVRTGWISHTSLAYAILNGSFSLSEPYGTTELIRDPTGRVYVAYGPTAAFFLMPLVAFMGRNINQTVASAVFGAVAVTLWWAFLGTMTVSPRSRKWLTALFAVGTPYFFYAAEDGNNWAITHCVAGLCLMASFYLGRTGRPGFAGLFLGLGVLSRNPVLFLTPVALLVLLAPEAERWRDVRPDWRKLAFFGLGMAFSLGIGAYYNWERFGIAGENGYGPILLNDPISDFGRKPAFALEYARHNIPHYFLNPPVRFDRFPWYGPDIAGTSMLLVTPILWLLPAMDMRRPLNQVGLVCILAVQALYLVFIGDGRGQFGMRYATDYLPVVMLLIAGITAQRFGKFATFLPVTGVLVELWGFVTWRALRW